ncbi:hypothetical protein M2323_002609 [Rhodoblastus acidophilus]|uniref:hypothetical protein n=1 Tax=Rhodoblastus acidophilus TaxID=1074 RepID=UPI002224068C|nr:hypothetical protein [Rhodoblastus acidophilus]MCW2284722.1 hypothetical protein [Rhodoblastus acidophilus]MCW2333675.1 hypothetical protein [Rhodoblastus acidophilus]
MRRANQREISPRLLTKQQAAEYCGLSLATFSAVCPVAPLAMQRLADGTSNKRLERFDVHLIDEWLDKLSQADGALSSCDDWLSRMDKADDGNKNDGSHARN